MTKSSKLELRFDGYQIVKTISLLWGQNECETCSHPLIQVNDTIGRRPIVLLLPVRYSMSLRIFSATILAAAFDVRLKFGIFDFRQ